MKYVVFLRAARADLDGISDYTAEHWGVEQAARYTRDIRDACHALAAGRRQGRPANVGRGYLKYLSGSHIIYYREQGDLLKIVRVLHGSMDATRHLHL